MLVMTYSEARQNFATVLEKSKNDGCVFVKRADGSMFKILPEQSNRSPFDGIKTLYDIRHEDIMSALKETREEN
ncbi:MAG: prevent-host-death protein [Treponema sp.]|nr:prevent-host-death protein [Spirochaetaceae bacterium]MBO4638260.1 prevent-host-death protein [Treponema sp.]MBR5645919.1 prevent-host-death protein [Treponema sp.]